MSIRQIEIISKLDNSTFETNTNSASHSGLLRSLIEDYKEENEFIIPDIRGEVLGVVIRYLETHQGKEGILNLPKPLKNYDLKEYISEEDFIFLERYNDDIYGLFELMNAANYLDVKSLLELCCAKAACLTKDLKTEQFLEVFQIDQDMSEEDIRKRLLIFGTEELIKNDLNN